MTTTTSSDSDSSSSSPFLITTRKGQKETPNQDKAMLVVQPTTRNSGSSRRKGTTTTTTRSNNNHDDNQNQFVMAAVWDGHGPAGHDSAERALLDLGLRQLVRQHAAAAAAASTATAASNHKSAQEFLRTAFERVDQGPISHFINSGTTAVVAWRPTTTTTRDDRLLLASVGDSTGLVVCCQEQEPQPPIRMGNDDDDEEMKNLNCTVVAQSVHHKPADAVERARIESAGGRIWIPPLGSSRVIYSVPADENDWKDPRVAAAIAAAAGNGMPATVETGLAMSRSLGDVEGKRPGYLLATPSIVTVEPLSQYLTTNNKKRKSCLFVILASDGVVDMVPVNDLSRRLGRAVCSSSSSTNNNSNKVKSAAAKENALLSSSSSSSLSLQATVQEIMSQAADEWAVQMQGTYRDDMTLVVAPIR